MFNAKLLAATALCVSFTADAFALSCVPTAFQIAPTYNNLAASKDSYMFIQGKFSGLPKNQGSSQNKKKLWQASFKGVSIGKSGLKPLNKKITVQSNCIASWCGRIPENGKSTIVAVKVGSNGSLKLESGACSPNQFQASQKNVKRIQTCMKQGSCQ